MKFKNMIIVFSIIIFILIIAILIPLLTGSRIDIAQEAYGSPLVFMGDFRFLTLPLLVFMILLLGFLGIFFLFNYRLLSLLERENWPALAYYLEQKIFVKGRYNTRFVRLLASSYLVISDYSSVLTLESKTLLAKPVIISKCILIFGAARILGGNHIEAAAFYKTHLDKGKIKKKDKQWAMWFYGFSFLLAGSFDLACKEFIVFCLSSNDAIITGISAFFLNNSIAKNYENPVECLAAAESGRKRVIKTIKNAKNWKKEVDSMSTDIHIAVIKKYIDEAGNWLFKNQEKIEQAVEL